MDKLDKFTIIIIAVLLLYGTALIAIKYDPSQAKTIKKHEIAAKLHVQTPELLNKIQLANNLIVQDNLEKSELLISSLLAEFPYEGKLYMLKGDILVRRQQPIAAMYEYKEAVMLNPDFLDKKAKLFQGKKIKVTVEEAMTAIESGLDRNPLNSKLKDDKQAVYFMKRKLAGSCG